MDVDHWSGDSDRSDGCAPIKYSLPHQSERFYFWLAGMTSKHYGYSGFSFTFVADTMASTSLQARPQALRRSR